jgi:hypothetical protein
MPSQRADVLSGYVPHRLIFGPTSHNRYWRYPRRQLKNWGPPKFGGPQCTQRMSASSISTGRQCLGVGVAV